MIALYIVAAVVLLIVVWDLSGRRSLKRFRLVEETETKNKPKFITPLQADPILGYAKFFYETAFHKKSDFERALTMLQSKDTSKMRVGKYHSFIRFYYLYNFFLLL